MEKINKAFHHRIGQKGQAQKSHAKLLPINIFNAREFRSDKVSSRALREVSLERGEFSLPEPLESSGRLKTVDDDYSGE